MAMAEGGEAGEVLAPEDEELYSSEVIPDFDDGLAEVVTVLNVVCVGNGTGTPGMMVHWGRGDDGMALVEKEQEEASFCVGRPITMGNTGWYEELEDDELSCE